MVVAGLRWCVDSPAGKLALPCYQLPGSACRLPGSACPGLPAACPGLRAACPGLPAAAVWLPAARIRLPRSGGGGKEVPWGDGARLDQLNEVLGEVR